MLTFALDAVAETTAIAVSNFDRSSADELNDFAITSVTLPISEVSKLKPRRVEAATLADSAKSSPVASARFNVASVTFVISVAVKPNFEKFN